jgi:hypothetical protein
MQGAMEVVKRLEIWDEAIGDGWGTHALYWYGESKSSDWTTQFGLQHASVRLPPQTKSGNHLKTRGTVCPHYLSLPRYLQKMSKK